MIDPDLIDPNLNLIKLGYLLAAILFILGLKGLTRPRTAVRGNLLGALGMLVAVVSVMLSSGLSYGVIAAGLAVGALIGALLALRVQMTDMPELVALFNGLGGGASALVAASIWSDMAAANEPVSLQKGVASGISMAIGALTLTGSAVAFAKLNGRMRKNFALPAHQAWNALLGIGLLVLIGVLATAGSATPAFWLLAVLSLVLGVSVVTPIGGADMPVVIALLNSMSGLAAAASGFVLDNNALIVSGSLVGASGLILTGIMCKAMNRTLFEVLFKSFGASTGGPSDDDVYAGKVKSTSAEEIAMLLETAGQVVIVPGYGMAVAQAQHAVRDLTQLLEQRGTKVLFGIHPVAGRMPGHMNVLLAEADIDYDLLMDLDAVNPMFRQTDVAIVIGANDVVNPSAREDTSSPIYGMPILDVDLAGTVIVVKRSLSAGFAGIPNPLFAADNALMFFDDAKKGMVAVSEAMKEL